MIHYLLEIKYFFSLGPEPLYIVIYCITSNAEHVTLRASVEYHRLESTKNILRSSERFIVR